jgi:hypothetical protein
MIWRLAPSLLACAAFAAEPSKNIMVYREDGRFAGWPANHGIWSWGNEILVGFEIGAFKLNPRSHAIDYSQPAEHVLARSLDGGETWRIERPQGLRPPPDRKIAGVPTGSGGRDAVEFIGAMDFTRPGFVFTARMEDIHVGPSRFYYSEDRGATWQGPFRLPDFGQKGIAARTDYLVNGKHDATVFLTAAKSNGREGRVIATRTRDGGKSWQLVSFVTSEPEGDDFAIMPSSVRLPDGTIVTAVRRRRFIELYRSGDGGRTWQFVNQPAPSTGGGNPPHMIRLRDGRLALTYGYRSSPFGIRARLSRDDGRTWSEEIILRADGGGGDLGYPRTVERPDGKLVTVYYFNDDAQRERYIAGTIWDPVR